MFLKREWIRVAVVCPMWVLDGWRGEQMEQEKWEERHTEEQEFSYRRFRTAKTVAHIALLRFYSMMKGDPKM
jgi:hypothetical protein